MTPRAGQTEAVINGYASTMRILLLATVIAAFAVGQKPPNIILFMVDDLGWQDVSVPFHANKTEFNRRYRTPNLEKLAARGVKITNGYASAPVCTPTRTSLMTGQCPARTHITYWTLRKDRDQSAKHALVRAPKWDVNALQGKRTTLPRALKAMGGYGSIHAGKAHLGAKGTRGEDPTNLGFDVNIAGHAAGGPGSYYGVHDFSAKHRSQDRVWDVPGLDAYHGKDIYMTEALAIEARKAMRKVAKRGRPFFVHFAPYAVHAPIMANKRFLKHYEGLHPKEAAYATMIETADAALGALLEEVEALGQSERTIVIFTSDNGGLSAHARGGKRHTHNAPLRSGKGSAYEGGVRVPWVVAWPGVTKPGSVNDQVVVTHDLFPTLLSMTGRSSGRARSAALDGKDLVPVLRGGALAGPERSVLWHMPHFWGVNGPGIAPYSAVRHGKWKLLYFHGSRKLELYDLDADIGETRDLSASRPEVLKRMGSLLTQRLRDAKAQMSIDVKTGEAVPFPDALIR